MVRETSAAPGARVVHTSGIEWSRTRALARHFGMNPIELARLAARHDHVLGPSVRAEADVSPATWGRLLRSPGVDRPFRGVGVLPGSTDRSLSRMRAALHAVRCDAAVTGWSAAFLYGLVTAAPTDVHLLTRHGASIARRDGLHVTESSTWPEGMRVQHGIQVVPAGRMLADLAAATDADALLDLAIDARFAGDLTRGHLDRELAARRRFPGRATFRVIADELREDTSDSGFEHRARHRLGDRGMAPDPGQHELVVAGRTRRIDLPYRDQRVGLECLGLAAHSGRRAFDEDARRRNDFAEHGEWLILELTWTMFHRGWEDFAARLDRVLRARAPR